jgi:LysM repeat protein
MPQSSLLEQKNKGRAKVKIAVFFVLAVHAIGLLALLMQGCRKEPVAPAPEQTNAVAPQAFENTNPAPVVDTNAAVAAVTTNVPPADLVPPTPPPAAETEYTIVAGDSFSKIASKFHVTTAALMAANPGFEPTKLQIGKKIKIPAPAPAASTTSTSTAAPANGETVYTVKSGDTLSKIATNFHTSVKVLRSANNLKTDSIKVGQKLTIPKSGSAAAPATAPADTTVPTNR